MRTQQEVVMYQYRVRFSAFFTRTAHQWFERDLKQRTKAGWQLISCVETGRDALRKPILTAIYERDTER